MHDPCREDEHDDPDHGQRGADNTNHMALCGLLGFHASEIVLLNEAITYYKDESLSDERAIATCWDADRLDHWCCRMVTAARFLSTDAAKVILKCELKQQQLLSK